MKALPMFHKFDRRINSSAFSAVVEKPRNQSGFEPANEHQAVVMAVQQLTFSLSCGSGEKTFPHTEGQKNRKTIQRGRAGKTFRHDANDDERPGIQRT